MSKFFWMEQNILKPNNDSWTRAVQHSQIPSGPHFGQRLVDPFVRSDGERVNFRKGTGIYPAFKLGGNKIGATPVPASVPLCVARLFALVSIASKLRLRVS